MVKKLEVTNLSGNIGKELMKKIYSTAYKLEATQVIIKESKYNRFAVVELHCEDGCIDWNYTVSI